ncbi:MAG: MlaD family protein [Paracoccaceae bacterium]
METKANYVLIGAFTLLGFLGILAFLMWFAKLSLNREFSYYDVHFPEVSGLSISADVRFAGLSVGKVTDMQLSETGDGTVRVRLEVREDTPVRKDSTASLEAQGVTGVYAVAISAGTPTQPLLRDSGEDVPEIQAGKSMLQTLTDQGPQIIDKLATVADQLTQLLGDENQQRVTNILNNVERSSANLDKALADVTKATDSIAAAAENIAAFGDKVGAIGDSAQTTLANADTALKKFTETATRADAALDSGKAALDEVQTYVANDLKGLTTRIDTAAATLDGTLAKLDGTLDVGKGTLESAGRAFDGADRVINTDVGPVVSDLRKTLASLNDAIARVVNDLPDITAKLRDAADSANSAFGGLRSMVDGLRSPVQTFARDGLPQFTRMAADMRQLAGNVNQFVTQLRRNPSQVISGQKTPEFRR